MEFLSYLASFWAVAWTLLFVAFVSYWVSWEQDVVALFGVIVCVAVLYFAGSLDPSFVYRNPLATLLVVACYYGIGLGWALVKWRFHVTEMAPTVRREWTSSVDKVRKVIEHSDRNPYAAASAEHQRIAGMSLEEYALSSQELRIDSNKARILRWMSWWPFSMLEMILSDLISGVWRAILRATRGAFETITRRSFR